jgi:1-acyl-sn-glycerol-3-phosphate acyltransferase
MLAEKFILTKLLGWKVTNPFPAVNKSIVVFAPHTSYMDAFIGVLALRSYGVSYKLLSKKELFRFPTVIVMRILGAIPVRGVKGHNAIYEAAEILKRAESMHLIICPEGQLAPTDRWNPGFYYMGAKAKVPIIAAYMDYSKKELGIKKVISSAQTKEEVFDQLAEAYQSVVGRHPENFFLPRAQGHREIHGQHA